MFEGFKLAIAKGIPLESEYPFVGKNGPCKVIPNDSYHLQNACIHMLNGNEDLLMQLLIKYGPLAVLMGSLSEFFLSAFVT